MTESDHADRPPFPDGEGGRSAAPVRSAGRRGAGRTVAGFLALTLGGALAVGGAIAVATTGPVTTVTTVLGVSGEQAGLFSILSGPTVLPPQPSADGTPLPARVTIPKLNLTSSLINLGLTSEGALQTPADYQQAGWYDGGTRPGDVGPAVIVGHIDSHVGPGIFYRLRSLAPGDIAQVQRTDATVVSYAVDRVAEYSKASFPTQTVYGATDGPQLRLITCGGTFDAGKGSYEDNVVVYAHEVLLNDPSAEPVPSILRSLAQRA